jgi:hypothetical protein
MAGGGAHVPKIVGFSPRLGQPFGLRSYGLAFFARMRYDSIVKSSAHLPKKKYYKNLLGGT